MSRNDSSVNDMAVKDMGKPSVAMALSMGEGP